MSRGRADDSRLDRTVDVPVRPLDHADLERIHDLPARSLSLPRGQEREQVEVNGRDYFLNGAETRTLATVGAFRVAPMGQGEQDRSGVALSSAGWRNLFDQRLLTRESLVDRHSSDELTSGGVRQVVALTREGKDLLDAHSTTRPDGRRQEFYASVVKPRELRHDVQLYRLYQVEAARIVGEGGQVTRVVLDYEMKRDYQRFLNREDRDAQTDLSTDRETFAAANDLTVFRGHLELPDLRIEYETADGRMTHRDLELVTEHYSRGQLAGKARAGFACYRAAQGGGNRRGGTPFNPHHLERLI